MIEIWTLSETPKARGGGIGRGHYLIIRLGGLEECRKLPLQGGAF